MKSQEILTAIEPTPPLPAAPPRGNFGGVDLPNAGIVESVTRNAVRIIDESQSAVIYISRVTDERTAYMCRMSLRDRLASVAWLLDIAPLQSVRAAAYALAKTIDTGAAVTQQQIIELRDDLVSTANTEIQRLATARGMLIF